MFWAMEALSGCLSSPEGASSAGGPTQWGPWDPGWFKSHRFINILCQQRNLHSSYWPQICSWKEEQVGEEWGPASPQSLRTICQRSLALLPHLLHEPSRVALKRLPLAIKDGDDECIRALTKQEPGNEDKTAGGSEARSPHRERPGGELIQRQQRLAFH